MKEQRKRNRKRWFAILLSVMFCFTLLPATAYAAPSKAQLDATVTAWNQTTQSNSDSKNASTAYPANKSEGSQAWQCAAYTRFAFKQLYGHFDTEGNVSGEKTTSYYTCTTASELYDVLKNKVVTGDAIRVTSSFGGTHIMLFHQLTGDTWKNAKLDVYESNYYDYAAQKDPHHNKAHYFTYKSLKMLVKDTMDKNGSEVTLNTTTGKLSHTVTITVIHSLKNPTEINPITVTFNANGGTVSEKSRTITKGSALGSFPKATRSGYRLKGWYRVNTAVASLKVTETQKINDNMMLFAVWTKNASTTTNTSAATKTYYVKGTDGTLVMRKGPGSNYGQQTLIPEGASVKVTPSKNSGSWWYVTYNGKSGYSYSKYLTTTAPKAKATQLIKNGTYEIAPNYATNMRLDVSGASKENGANVQLYKANGSNAQKWKFKHLGNDYYTITCVCSGKALDVAGANTKPGTNVQQWGSNSSNAQIWKVKKADNGSYYLCPKLNEKVCLDVYKGGKTNSTNVTTWTLNNAYNQKWKIF